MNPSITTKTQLLSAIHAERAKLEKLIQPLTPDQFELTESMTPDAWTIKDMLAHLAVWSSRAITLLFEVEHGAKPTFPKSSPDGGYDAVNHADWLEQRERPLDRILADFHGTHLQLIKRLDNWRDETQLFDIKIFNIRGMSLASFVWGDSGEHDAEHAGVIAGIIAKRDSLTGAS